MASCHVLRNPLIRLVSRHSHSHLGCRLFSARKFLGNERWINHINASSNSTLVTCLSHASSLLPVSPVSWSVIRTYAKKGKDKGGKPHKKVTLTSDQLEGLVDLDKVKGEMEHTMEDLKEKFIHQVTVRTSQGVFDNLIIKTPDGNFPLIQLGQVVQKSPQLIVLNMAAAPQYITNVKEALAASGLNINPQQDSTSLFLPLPKVTREHREVLAKNAKMLSEKSKKHLRDIFSRVSKKIKSSKGGHSSDDIMAAVDMVEELMHGKIHQIEAMTTLKQKELMGTK